MGLEAAKRQDEQQEGGGLEGLAEAWRGRGALFSAGSTEARPTTQTAALCACVPADLYVCAFVCVLVVHADHSRVSEGSFGH